MDQFVDVVHREAALTAAFLDALPERLDGGQLEFLRYEACRVTLIVARKASRSITQTEFGPNSTTSFD